MVTSTPPTRSSATIAGVSPPPVDPPSPVDDDELDSSEDEREARMNILENLKRITITGNPAKMRYHGKSSNMMFLQTVIKQKYPGSDRPKGSVVMANRPDFANGPPPVDFPVRLSAPPRLMSGVRFSLFR